MLRTILKDFFDSCVPGIESSIALTQCGILKSFLFKILGEEGTWESHVFSWDWIEVFQRGDLERRIHSICQFAIVKFNSTGFQAVFSVSAFKPQVHLLCRLKTKQNKKKIENRDFYLYSTSVIIYTSS